MNPRPEWAKDWPEEWKLYRNNKDWMYFKVNSLRTLYITSGGLLQIAERTPGVEKWGLDIKFPSPEHARRAAEAIIKEMGLDHIPDAGKKVGE